jgi:hypothetical protein
LSMIDRIITRPDFDGIVCAALLREALGRDLPIYWAQPHDMQNGRIHVAAGDIIANLPLYGECALWFDHHITNAIQRPYKGLFRVAPSAAGLIQEYFNADLSPQFDTLVTQTDKIDSAQLNLDEILHPERYPYILVSMTTSTGSANDEAFWNHLVELLRTSDIEQVMRDPRIQQRCHRVVSENKAYETYLKRHTRVQQGVSITDFRDLDPVPNGNRFLVYSLFPESFVNMKIYYEKDKTAVKIGHSIINCNCKVNVGGLLAGHGGGGHHGAGACRLEKAQAEKKISEILQILIDNRPNEPN